MKRFFLLVMLFILFVGPAATQDETSVRAVLFWMEDCPHCSEIIDRVLPSLAERFGDRLEIQMVEVKSVAEVNAL